MKRLGLLAVGLAVTSATIMGAGPAHADFTDQVEVTDSGENEQEAGFGEYAVSRNQPGSCLVVQNHTGGTVTLRLNYPTSRGKWTLRHDSVGVLARNGKVVTSPSGRWSVRTNPPIRWAWIYDGNLNTRKGCNGSWVLTMN
ncbi:hypothetical protein [Nocardia rhizosphaerae]|uniref:Uncharacterized protein n=1 Tax=Nocardia rhizosphaerae TaxID=1691571 RepID=A0ABV8L0P8_9NOCA